MSDEKNTADKQPRRWIAVLLCVLGPWGIGQFYLGQSRRAVAWLLLPAFVFAVVAFALAPVGAVLGYGKLFALLVCSILVALAAAVLDVLAIP